MPVRSARAGSGPSSRPRRSSPARWPTRTAGRENAVPANRPSRRRGARSAGASSGNEDSSPLELTNTSASSSAAVRPRRARRAAKSSTNQVGTARRRLPASDLGGPRKPSRPSCCRTDTVPERRSRSLTARPAHSAQPKPSNHAEPHHQGIVRSQSFGEALEVARQ